MRYYASENCEPFHKIHLNTVFVLERLEYSDNFLGHGHHVHVLRKSLQFVERIE